MRDSEWSKILGWPGYRVYQSEINESAKTLHLWVRRKRGNHKLVCSGCLQITWPTLIADNSPVILDLLLATATQPDLTSDPPWYPIPQMIAELWRNDREDNVRYFRNNVQSGIRTFGDDAIQAALTE